MSWLGDRVRDLERLAGQLLDGVQISGGVGGGSAPHLSIDLQNRKLFPLEVLVIAAALALVVGVLIGRR